MKFVSIHFFSHNIKFQLKNKSVIKKWILSVIKTESPPRPGGFRRGCINYIFCDDEFLLSLNKKFLKHDTLTDIITFDYSQQVSSDIFIGIPRVKQNAKKFNASFEKELMRVMIHGILHLCGYNDKTKKEKVIIRKKEEEYLSRLPSLLERSWG